MTGERRERELVALKTIAETLNRSTDLQTMLQTVLEKLLSVTGLTTGWIFLVDEEPEYAHVADCQLPPALLRNAKQPMCEGSCWCLERFWDGRLQHAVNIINCKRLEDAVALKWGDTRNITHHATVPLAAGGELFGLLNVASPGKEHFSEDELTLLQSVAYQIGTAVKRIWLFEAQQKRADNYARLHEVSRSIWKVRDVRNLPKHVVQELGRLFDWSYIAYMVSSGGSLRLKAWWRDGEEHVANQRLTEDIERVCREVLRDGGTLRWDNAPIQLDDWPAAGAAVAVPLFLRGKGIGVLWVGSECKPRRRAFDDSDLEVLKAVAEHIGLAMESARLEQQKQELAVSEERNRLARDLHDSVNQKLFSLSLTAKGAIGVMREENPLLQESLEDIHRLSQEALREMRSLIWQLRPQGLEEGLATALKKYGSQLGLTVYTHVEGVHELPRRIEEALWRIGQEALNNVSKHAETEEVDVNLQIEPDEVTLEVRDQGKGFSPELDSSTAGRRWSLGINGMKERAELLGGSVWIESRSGAGTTVRAHVPVK
ncbi:histidine kinase [Marinithermofilum abyssi]|uniref:histidine kinase n=1 Tax=Marinithermofilum abyssi TaxID=1571185 RepID=A0A8J2VG50_9BACL|nr:GAF domain-containing sensor histidine kinase [Marinithermofilum abyssi]GGE07029.1 histidine kinase [Marinithermofilum abyssi]